MLAKDGVRTVVVSVPSRDQIRSPSLPSGSARRRSQPLAGSLLNREVDLKGSVARADFR